MLSTPPKNNTSTTEQIDSTDKQKKRDYDPILDDPLSGEENTADGNNEGSSSGEEEEDELIDVEFPRDSASDLLIFLHRDLTNIENMEDAQKRKFALIRLYEIFVLAKNKAPRSVYQEILSQIQKKLFKRLQDKVEKNRELAALLIKEFFSQCDDLTLAIPYLIPVLVDRLNADDLEGVDYIEDKLKPTTVQKPQIMIDPPEDSEEVRIILAEIVTIIVSTTIFDCLRAYIDPFVNILRAFCMDPCGAVIIEGCQGISEFCGSGGTMLMHFCESMGRSLFTAFCHKHAKVRIAGLKALFNVVSSGCWKTSVNVFEHMVGFKDPNLVPIKEFYEVCTRLNYFAQFVQDRSILVRECFYKEIGNMFMNLTDKVDHEGRLYPYLISGLFDDSDQIKQCVFEILEEAGAQHERENEEKFRELKQTGFQSEWLMKGQIKAEDLMATLPTPFAHRPCLGARVHCRSYIRRYLNGIYAELTSWQDESKERASCLLLVSLIYGEDHVTNFLDGMLISMYKAMLEKENKVVMKNMPECFRVLGRYCPPKSYTKLVMHAIKNELASVYSYTQTGAIKAFGHLFKGAIELMNEKMDLSKVQELLDDFVFAIKESVLDSLDQETAPLLLYTLDVMCDELVIRKEKGVDISIVHEHLKDLFYFVIKSAGVLNNFRFINKPEPDSIRQDKEKALKILNNLQKISEKPDDDFFESYLVEFFDEQFAVVSEQESQISVWPLQNQEWRMFYVVFDNLKTHQFQIELSDKSTIFDRVAQIMFAILKNGASKNLKTKNFVLNKMFPVLVNKNMNVLTSKKSNAYLQIMVNGAQIEWPSKDEARQHEKQMIVVHKGLHNADAIRLSHIEDIEEFKQVLQTLRPYIQSKLQEDKREGLKMIMKYLELFNSQVVEKLLDEASKTAALQKTDFLCQVLEDLLPLYVDYYDDIKEPAYMILKLMVDKFLNFQPSFNQDQKSLIQSLRAQITQGWPDSLNEPVKICVDMEKEMSKYMFENASDYFSQIIAVMMDEPFSREILGNVVVSMNKSMPFLMMNDLRIAMKSNSLQRVEVLKALLQRV